MTKPIELLTMGGAYVDINCTQFPFGKDGLLPETEAVGNAYEVVPGGSALNFARFCASLGLRTSFIGKIGKDKMGTLLTELVQESGVQPEFISDAQTATNISLNLVNPAGASIMAVAGNAQSQLAVDEARSKLTALLPEADYFMLGGALKSKTLMPLLEGIVADAHAAKTKIIVDHGRLSGGITEKERQLIQNLALGAGYYLPSREEFLKLWSFNTVEKGLKELAKRSHTQIVVKDSANGAITISNHEIVRVPAFPVDAANTIGAGDSFNAGFITAQRLGSNLVDSMKFACATAALKISRPELPTPQAVTDFLKEHN